MKNFVQPGHNITAVAPAGGVSSGDPVLIGNVFGVAAFDAIAGAEVELSTVGVFDLPKTTSLAFTFGDIVYFDATAGEVTPNDATGANLRIGVVLSDAAMAAITWRVRLDGAAA